MIEFTNGDMFEKAVDIRVNTVNCKGVMGAGVALVFKDRYPKMFKDYKKACTEGMVRPGSMFIWKNLLGDWIINFPTKRDWREPSRYEDILSGLDALRNYLKDLGPISVALPALGCGRGGLDWSQVSQAINEKLGDLDAHIFVFKPFNSSNSRDSGQKPSSVEQIKELEELGFKSTNLPLEFVGEGLPPAALIKGDDNIFTQKWVALLPSKDPTDREIKALTAVARQMALEEEELVIALVYATRATEKIIEIFLNFDITVVLILPFGALARKSVTRMTTNKQPTPFAVVSISAPSEAWSRSVLAQAMTLFRTGAASVLLTDPTPSWLSSKFLQAWTKRNMFFLRYENQTDEMFKMLLQRGARPIGRCSDSGEPNLSPLLCNSTKKLPVEYESSVESGNRVTVPLTNATVLQLSDLVKEIQRTPLLDVKVDITVSCGPGTEDLQEALSCIFKNDIKKD